MIRVILVVLEIVIGVAALGGGLYLVLGARGMPRGWLEGTPFRTYLVPGLVLIVVVGGSMLLAAGLLLVEASRARTASLMAGVLLIAWIMIQVSMMGHRHWLQPLFGLLGFVVAALAFFLPAPG